MSNIIEETASELENLIADFIPNEDKDVSRNIAVAVATHITPRMFLAATPDGKVKDKLTEVVRHISINEYTMMREALALQLKGRAK